MRYSVKDNTDSPLGSTAPSWASGNKTFEIIDNIFYQVWKKARLKAPNKISGEESVQESKGIS